MIHPIKINNHPFRFLLYLEWILFGFTVLISIIPFASHESYQVFSDLTMVSLTLFGLMGLRLPKKNQISKITYTIIEILLIIIISSYGGKTARFFSFFYIILVIRSCLIFQFPSRLIVTGLSYILFLITLTNRLSHIPLSAIAKEKSWFLHISFALTFGLSLVFVLILMNVILSERHSRENLAIANEKLREYALQIENQATLEERNRIAREIHDSLGHSLTALNLQLETALKLWHSNPDKAQSFLVKAKELGSKSLYDVRQSVSAIRYHPLQAHSLEESIVGLVENVHRSTGIAPNCTINLLHPVPIEINTAIYRIIQESFTNICKYAQATVVTLELTTIGTSIELMIQDNGIGFDLAQNSTGFGLQSMRDRTLGLRGDFEIDSFPGLGCIIRVEIPLQKSSLGVTRRE